MATGRQQISGVAAAILVAGLLSLGGCRSQPPEAGSVSTPTAEVRDLSQLRLRYGRSPETLNPHLATGVQDFEAARIVYEPLASYNAQGQLIPFLAAEIPTAENGGVAADGRSVTWRLRQNVQWSDGEPFSAADVVFTFEFIRNPQVAAATAQYYEQVEAVEAVDEHTVKVTFTQPNPAWAVPFTGETGLILPRHIFAELEDAAVRQAAVNLQPVGTGPYQVVSFGGGTILFEPNPNYWDGEPAFQQVELQAGMAPYAAARSVLKSGEADFAFDLQVDGQELQALEQDGQGRVITLFGSSVERLMLNFAHPFLATEAGERANPEIPHPFFSDLRVRQAIAYAIDRDAIASQLYGPLGRPSNQILVAPARYNQPIPYRHDPEQARALLEAAGWQDSDGDGIRDREGTPLQVVVQAPVNPVRQQTQALLKEQLEAVGIEIETKRVRVDAFFSSDPEETDSLNHFYSDLQLYTTGNDSPDPSTYMGWWTCDNMASQANNWQLPNNARYCNPQYDQLWQAAVSELDRAARTDLFNQMDALLIEEVAVIPLVHRALANAVHASLVGVSPTPWDASTWDIKHWQRQDE